MIKEEIVGSHTDESGDVQIEKTDIPTEDVFELFGIEKQEETKEEKAEDDPAIDQPEPKTIKVKYNKEEIEVPEEKVPEYVQKGLALDKERERRGEYEKALDRAAKLQGFKDHADLMANLDRIEQEREQAQRDEFEQLKQRVIEDLVLSGVDEETAINYAENNPLVKQAREALQEREQIRHEQTMAQKEQEYHAKWDELYDAFPELTESAEAFREGGTPDWYTKEMESMIQSGYHPLHAYKLAHMDKIQTQTKRATEQRIIKEQMLGLRSKVETTTTPDNEPQVSPALESVFAAFGLPVQAAKKYAKK